MCVCNFCPHKTPKTVKEQKMTVKNRFFGKSEPLSTSQTKCLNIFLYTVLTATITTLVGILLFYIYSLANMYHGTASGPSMWLLGIFSDFVEIMSFSLEDSPISAEWAPHIPPWRSRCFTPSLLYAREYLLSMRT